MQLSNFIFIILFIYFYWKKTNSIENLLEQTSEKQFYWVWNRAKKYAVQVSRTILSNFSVSHFLRKHQFINWSKIARRRRQLYYLIARRRFCIHINHKNATYNKFHLYELFDHYSSTKIAIWINHIIHATNFARDKVYERNDVETSCRIHRFTFCLVDSSTQ